MATNLGPPDSAVTGIFQSYARRGVAMRRADAGVDVPDTGPVLPPPAGASGRSIAVEEPTPSDSESQMDLAPINHVGIIGAGVAGLSAAMKLQSLGYEVDVLEANKRTGGRLYTHKFENGGEWDYFDVGAMRFPDTDLMKKTFDLFRNTLKLPLQPYSISQDKNYMYYNNIRKRKSEVATAAAWEDDPFKVCGSLKDEAAKRNPSDILYEAVKPWLLDLKEAHKIQDPENRDKALWAIFDKVDKYSTRSYLAEKGYSETMINWIETMSFGTGWFDRAFIETVMEELAFQYDKPSSKDLDWYCVKGGSEKIITHLEDYITAQAQKFSPVAIKTQHQVTAVELHQPDSKSKDKIKKHPHFTVSFIQPIHSPEGKVTWEESKITYSHVIFAIPPPCIRMIEFINCQLDFAQRQALRELQLAPSSKIGMKFKTAWWKDSKVGITEGGQSTTDRVARTIVYPSQGNFESTVLIVSYCWTQDSLALGALMQEKGSQAYERLKQIMLLDLAKVHGLTFEKLEKEFDGMYPFDWSHNPFSIGAFGLFGPGQFSKVYSSFARPAARTQMHFIGETFSTIHGWVAGALESADRGVAEMLLWSGREEQSFPPPPTAGQGVPTEGQGPIDDPIERFKEMWDPQFMIDEQGMLAQIALSIKLQAKEFSK
ncbi:hypothetical protein FRC07_000492 [Ceratobasidium sp. 392]|nr:hypothetical protein FRC07_000492 [Ceratobasidium sp. 392]